MGRNYYKEGLVSNSHSGRALAYQTGARTLPREVVGFRLINTPGYMLDEINRLDGEIKTSDQDLKSYLSSHGCAFFRDGTSWSDPLDPGAITRHGEDAKAIAANTGDCIRLEKFYDGPWTNFVTKWEEFKSKHDSSTWPFSWYERFWGSLMETVDAYRAQLQLMRGAARAVGFGITTPDPVSPRKGLLDQGQDALSGLAGMFKYLFYTALIVGGAVLLIWGVGTLKGGGGNIGKFLVVKK